MRKNNIFHWMILVLLVLSVISTLDAQTRRQRPPEYKEISAAARIQNPADKLKELEKIKAAYPESQMMNTIENLILNTKIEMASTLKDVLALQKEAIASSEGLNKLAGYFQSASQIIDHAKISTFNPNEVLETILVYQKDATKLAENPELFQEMKQDQSARMKAYYVTGFGIPIAQAYLLAGKAQKALDALKTYKDEGGAPNIVFYYVYGEANLALGNKNEAYNSFLAGAVEPARGTSYGDAAERAKALYTEIKGSAQGFDAELEAQMKALPYHPAEYTPAEEWKGKAVLAELFTGSECPPCVGADLGFDGLLESYDPKYLVILQYHLPIPRPDPMMNPATKIRQDYYGVNSTPTVVIEGTNKMIGGGNRGMAEGKYEQYKAAIDPLITAVPPIQLKVNAKLEGRIVKVECDFDKLAPEADYHVVLVQEEQEYKGSNGLMYHKMVVRDIIMIHPVTKDATFDLDASENATNTYLTEFEKTYTRIPNFKWSVRHFKIARQGLKVVFFAQDRESKQILNAVIADVK
ncbi:hypothetical protein ACFLT9_03010 [Acidobacteriota bacterium]